MACLTALSGGTRIPTGAAVGLVALHVHAGAGTQMLPRSTVIGVMGVPVGRTAAREDDEDGYGERPRQSPRNASHVVFPLKWRGPQSTMRRRPPIAPVGEPLRTPVHLWERPDGPDLSIS
ncbi:hypothetical protein DB31_2031 [Hyalangium minutum]|uniref:Uncharacterized protein n=1 Tax=Hyalangium minutum TaxID=394096 RepID=A0A085W974_9BACT|nr:hypothetical protein DB31_2031 [Hyalangium minutum]